MTNIRARQPYARRPAPQGPLKPFLDTELANVQRAVPIPLVRAVFADDTVQANDDTIEVDATAGPITITLPPADRFQFLCVTMIRVDASTNDVLVSGDMNGTTAIALQAPGDCLTVQSDGATWLVLRTPPDEFNVIRFGAVGDGVHDDAAAILRTVVAAGPSRPVVLPLGLVYRCASVLTFDQAGQTIVGGGATLLFDGPNTSRLLNITASDVTCDGVIFDGNGKQPAYALVAVADNAARPQFPGCRFQHCTGTATNTTALNQTYGLMISPYGVTDFAVLDCAFANLLKHNDTATVGTPTIGWGFCGGIFFYNGAEPTAPQTVPSSGVIDNCDFENIRTILDVGLTENNHIEFDDADGIRFYGVAGGASQFPVAVTNTRYRQVSKRAIKQGGAGTTQGIQVENVEVDASGLPYPMVSIIKLDNGCVARNLRCTTGGSAARVIVAAELDGNQDVLLDGVSCDFVENAIEWLPAAGSTADNVAVTNVRFPDVSQNGFLQSGATPATQSRIRLENAEFVCTGVNAAGITMTRATDATSGAVLRNVDVVNGTVFVDGDGSDVDGLRLTVTSNAYAGPTATTSLLTLGLERGTGTLPQQWANITINALGIATTWNTVNRTVAFLYGDRQRLSHLDVRVPNGMGVASGDFFVAGDQLVWDGLTYAGPNFVSVSAAAGPIVGGVFRHCTRIGTATAATAFFIVNQAATDNVTFEHVTDLLTSAQSVIRLLAGGHFAVDSVITTSTVSPIVERTAVTACAVKNLTVIGGVTPTIGSAATIGLTDGYDAFFISGTATITSVTAADWEGQTILLVFLAAATLTDGSNLKLAGNFVATADDTITLTCLGGNWYERGRSIN